MMFQSVAQALCLIYHVHLTVKMLSQLGLICGASDSSRIWKWQHGEGGGLAAYPLGEDVYETAITRSLLMAF